MLQSVLNAAGIQAGRIESLWWAIFWTTTVVTVIVLAVLAVALRRGGRAEQPAGNERALLSAVGIASAATVVILIGLLVRSVITSRAIASERDNANPLQIEVTAYQWWWNFEYQHPEPAQRVRTANELHLPVGRPIAIKLLASDVIHSFWVPSLHGKLDAIPGHEATLYLRVDKPGIYRGQCAEYCGVQHAHMAFAVVAESSDDFEKWIQAQRDTAHQPESDQAKRGLQLVQQSACVMCHTIRGTAAGGRIAPDLTHIATRATIGAGVLPRDAAHLAEWIRDPQHAKPGNRMPALALSDGDRDAIAAYLEQLR